MTTDLLRGRVERLTCVEIDRAFANSLSRRMSGHNVTVVRQDATAMSSRATSASSLFLEGALEIVVANAQHIKKVPVAG